MDKPFFDALPDDCAGTPFYRAFSLEDFLEIIRGLSRYVSPVMRVPLGVNMVDLIKLQQEISHGHRGIEEEPIQRIIASYAGLLSCIKGARHSVRKVCKGFLDEH